MAAQVSGREDPISHLHNIECGPVLTPTTAEDLANIINQTFLEPMKAFDPLPSSPTIKASRGIAKHFVSENSQV